MKSKICSICKQEKDLKEYYKLDVSKDGLFYHCRECEKKRQMGYRRKHKERIKEYNKKYFSTHKEIIINIQTKYNKKHKLEKHARYKANYSIPLNENCEICGQKATK